MDVPLLDPTRHSAQQYADALAGPMGYHHKARDEAIRALDVAVEEAAPLEAAILRLEIAIHTMALGQTLAALGAMSVAGCAVPDLDDKGGRH